jgi:hypothetical protein
MCLSARRSIGSILRVCQLLRNCFQGSGQELEVWRNLDTVFEEILERKLE